VTALDETLQRLAADLDTLDDDWWLIGSAALVLNGVELATIGDVDLLTTPAAATRLAERWGCDLKAPGATGLFRSDVHFQRTETPLPVDVMAGFQVKSGAVWRPVWPKTRVAIHSQGGTFYTPSRTELLDLLVLFDRPKDRERAALLRALPG
jgi:hypothetical protein